MSKRHQSNRRKAYGRRQHEVAERRQRDVQPETIDHALDGFELEGMADGLAFLGHRTTRLQFALGD